MTHHIKTNDEMIHDNLIVKMLAGSHAYGTNIATSDVDYRGIFVADPIHLRTPFYPVGEVDDKSEEDTKIYELSKFMKLSIDCNPNVIELLWTAPEDITFTSPGYELLRSYAPQLLSSKIAFTTSGYALSQLKRIKGHNKWINQGDRGIQKLRTLYKEGNVDLGWLEQHFSEDVIRLVTK